MNASPPSKKKKQNESTSNLQILASVALLQSQEKFDELSDLNIDEVKSDDKYLKRDDVTTDLKNEEEIISISTATPVMVKKYYSKGEYQASACYDIMLSKLASHNPKG